MSDFGFYGEDEDKIEEVEINGITSNISKYNFLKDGVTYPCIILNEGITFSKTQLNILSMMVKISEKEEKDISLYLFSNKDLFKWGSISGRQVSSFIDLVGLENVRAFFDKDTEISDSRIYVLSC